MDQQMNQSPDVNMTNNVDSEMTNNMTDSEIHSTTNASPIVPDAPQAASNGVSPGSRKRTSEQVFGEFVTGESSNSGGGQAPANAPKRHAGMSSATAACTCVNCPQHGTSGHPREGGSTAAPRNITGSWSSAEVQRALQAVDNYNAQAEAVNSARAAAFYSSLGYLFGQPSSLYRNSPAQSASRNNNNVPPGSYMFAPPTGGGNNMNVGSGFFTGIGGIPQFHLPPPPSASSGSNDPLQPSRYISSWIQRLRAQEEYLRAWMSNGTSAASSSQVPNINTNAAAAAASRSRGTLTLTIEAPGGIYQRRSISIAPYYIADNIRLRDEIHNVIELLRNGGTPSPQYFLILDYSILLSLLASIRNNVNEVEVEIENEDEDEDHDDGFDDTGLFEAEALELIGRETFQSIPNENEENDVCCICQEDYVNGEELGRLDCGHKYHLACIIPWLVRKNSCPICKQTAIEIGVEEDEEENENEE